jgi:hypothetical protein
MTETETAAAVAPPGPATTDTFDVALPVRAARDIARELDQLVELFATLAPDTPLRAALADHYHSPGAADWLPTSLGHWAHTLRTARPVHRPTPAPAPEEGPRA